MTNLLMWPGTSAMVQEMPLIRTDDRFTATEGAGGSMGTAAARAEGEARATIAEVLPLPSRPTNAL